MRYRILLCVWRDGGYSSSSSSGYLEVVEEIFPINQPQRRDDTGCPPRRLLFKSGLSWGVSRGRRVKCGFEFVGLQGFVLTFPSPAPNQGKEV